MNEQGTWAWSHHPQRCDKCRCTIRARELFVWFERHRRKACGNCAL